MLAERRRKVVYSNPRGLLWANDKQKFGQRLMESMGWQEGQGLGRTKSGTNENIKASMKFNSQGLGFKPSAANCWIEDNNAYDQILTDLAKHHTDTVEAVNSVQKTRKPSKGDSKRLQHFKRTIKAKNLEGKSERDLLEIIPTRKAAEEPQDVEEIASTSKSELSVNDYFQMKMKPKSISSSTESEASFKKKKQKVR